MQSFFTLGLANTSSAISSAAIANQLYFTSACRRCRNSGVPCDGATPKCENCLRQKKECLYAKSDIQRDYSVKNKTGYTDLINPDRSSFVPLPPSLPKDPEQSRRELEYEQTRRELKPNKLQPDCSQLFGTSPYVSYKDVNPDRSEGTCRWFLDSAQFDRWYNSSSNELLWVSADPGCGKSVLSRSLVDHELASTTQGTTCYFFFKDNVKQKRLAPALCAVLHQLFSNQPHLLRHALPSYETNGGRIQEEIELLWRILLAAVSDQEALPVTCVFDGLDECRENDRKDLITRLCHFYKKSSETSDRAALKFLVTSRPYDNVERCFEKITLRWPQIRFRGENKNDAIRDEISLVIDQELNKLVNEFRLRTQDYRQLRHCLQEATNRTYLWVHLVLEEIRLKLRPSARLNPKDFLIDDLPFTVQYAYERILQRITEHQRPYAQAILSIIVGAKRPLTVGEVSLAFSAMELRTENESPFENLDSSLFENKLRQICGLFVYVNHSKFFLIHQTAKEFLLDNSPNNFFWYSWKSSLVAAQVELDMATRCINYLCHTIPMEDWSNQTTAIGDENDTFFEYCAEHWTSHLCDDHILQHQNLLKLVLKLYDTADVRFWSWFPVWWRVFRPYEHVPIIHDQHVIAMNGHIVVLRERYKSEEFDLDQRDSTGTTALMWAAANGHQKVVEWLLDKGAAINAQGDYYGSALQMASEKGHEKIVKVLLKHGADVNAGGGRYNSALQAASFEGHANIVQMLLERGADVDAHPGIYGNALKTALMRGHNRTAHILATHSQPPRFIADSWHASRNVQSNKVSNLVTRSSRSNLESSISPEDDAVSTYSDDSVTTSQLGELMQNFTKQFVKDLTGKHGATDWLEHSFDDLDDMFADFSLRLGREDATVEAKTVVKFVHKNRRTLARAIKAYIASYHCSFAEAINYQPGDCDNNEDDDEASQRSTFSATAIEEHDAAVGKSLTISEKMEIWRQNTTDYDHLEREPSSVPPDEPSDFLAHPSSLFQEYYDLVSRTSSYEWLKSTLRRMLYVDETDAALMHDIKNTILGSFPRPLRIGRRLAIPSFSAQFVVDWPVRTFIQNKGLPHSESRLLSALTITGVTSKLQALTCAAYVEQIWPENGKNLLYLIDEVLRTGQEQTHTRKDRTQLTAAEHGTYIRFMVLGSRGAIAEVGQQICWLGAALRSYGNKKIMLCCPRVRCADWHQETLPNIGRQLRAPGNFEITFSLVPITETQQRDNERDGTCWLDMFSSASVASGFPIAGRRCKKHGLEMPLNIMAALIGTEFVDDFDEKLFIKGHSSMLVSSQVVDDLIVWHHCRTKAGTYISYFDHNVTLSQRLELDLLSRSRHIIGWCEKADFRIGTAGLTRQVRESRLKPDPRASSSLLRGCHLTFPMQIGRGDHFTMSPEQRPSQLAADSYETIFRTLKRKFVLLWDVEENRGWFANAVSVLLHLMRYSLRISQDLLAECFVLKAEDLKEPTPGIMTAKRFLSNVHNLRAKVAITRTFADGSNEYEILETRMARFYHVLRQAFDLQRKRLDSHQHLWRRLEGWDFIGLAGQEGSSVRSITIAPEAKGWAELVKATGSITLFGRGFGELISPSNSTTSHCTYWQTLPTNKSYVTIATADLIEMARAYELDITDQSGEIAPNVIWHKPPQNDTHGACGVPSCMTSSIVQVLVLGDKRPDLFHSGQDLDIDRFDQGAFVFGHNEDVDWQWPDDEACEGSPEVVASDIASLSKSEELSRDSGYDSMNSATNLLSRMYSDDSYATQPKPSSQDAKLNESSYRSASQRVYAQISFQGGSAHLGDHMGNRYENCQFHLWPAEDPRGPSSLILEHGVRRYALLRTATNYPQTHEPSTKQGLPTLTANNSSSSVHPCKHEDSCPQTNMQPRLATHLRPVDHDEENPDALTSMNRPRHVLDRQIELKQVNDLDELQCCAQCDSGID